jgi:hypothetical protein
MYGRHDIFDGHMGHELEDFIPNIEEEFPIHFSGISRPRFEDDDDFWYSDPYFNEICAEECALFEEEKEAEVEEQDFAFFRFETAPLRHLRKKKTRGRF